jgi:hypothetical protein
MSRYFLFNVTVFSSFFAFFKLFAITIPSRSKS